MCGLLGGSVVLAGSTVPVPVAVTDLVSMNEDDTLQVQVLANDQFLDQMTGMSIFTSPGYGTATLDPVTHTITYIPNPDFWGWDSFYYEIHDGSGNQSKGLVNIQVMGINDPPTSADQTITINENEDYYFRNSDFIYNDVDGNCFNGFKIVSPLSEDLGDLYYSSADVILDMIYADPESLSFLTHEDAYGTTSFDFKVVDDQGAESEAYTMTIHILHENLPPETADFEVTMESNSIFSFTSELSYSDPEGDPFGGFRITSLPFNGNLAYSGAPVAAGTVYPDFTLLTYAPPADEEGSPYTEFTFTVLDDHQAESEEATGTINVVMGEHPIIISQGYSPNGDQINDYWCIEHIEDYPDNVVHIYNRWGNLVRSIEGYNNGEKAWRGESDHGLYGSTVTNGSYFYVLDLGNGTPPIQGYIVLTR